MRLNREYKAFGKKLMLVLEAARAYRNLLSISSKKLNPVLNLGRILDAKWSTDTNVPACLAEKKRIQSV